MHIVFRELRAHTKGCLIWAMAMTAFLFLSMLRYTTLAADKVASQELMELFPSTIKAVFGMTGLDITTMDGYYGICFIFIAVMMAIQAGMLGSELLAKEEISKTVEFLYVKPISRGRVLSEKIVAGALWVLALWAVTVGGSYLSMAWANNGVVPVAELVLFALALLVIQLTFFAVGLVSAALSRQPRRAAAAVAFIIFLAYLADVAYKLSPWFDWIKYISPFVYFDAKTLLDNRALDNLAVFICSSVCVVAIIVTYVLYRRRDLKV